MSKKKSANPKIKMETSKGTLTIELFPEQAPITVENFLQYVDDNYYTDTIFHRVIGSFMIQGGGFTADLEQKETRDPIKNEAANGLSNKCGTLAMARTGVVDSATGQFFINVVDNNFLDYKDDSAQGFGYCVFGEVIEGLDVIDEIKKVKTANQGHYQDVPVEPVVILSTEWA